VYYYGNNTARAENIFIECLLSGRANKPETSPAKWPDYLAAALELKAGSDSKIWIFSEIPETPPEFTLPELSKALMNVITAINAISISISFLIYPPKQEPPTF